MSAGSDTPLGLLRAAQADARKEYDRAKSERDSAVAAARRAQQAMDLWDGQLNAFQRAISAISVGAGLVTPTNQETE